MHCGGGPVTRPRGLCWACYYQPRVRDLYRGVNEAGERSIEGHRNLNLARPLPPEPTQAQPGSEEKVRVLEQRRRDGYALWHPDDFVPPKGQRRLSVDRYTCFA